MAADHPVMSINWREFVLSVQKYRRKTVPFGEYNKKTREHEDEIYLRELAIAAGGIGCALWDAAIIFSRWLYAHRELFAGQRVLELGSGVGLPGLVVGHYAEDLIMSDYLDSLVENLEYNLRLNTNLDLYDDPDDEEMVRKYELKQHLIKAARVVMLDWKVVPYEDEPVGDEQSVDVIIGSELVYSPNVPHMFSLLKVIKRYLKRDGVFYSIQSDDREGMPYFCQLMRDNGFVVSAGPPEERFLGNYNTGQRPETYKFFTMRFADEESRFPLMSEPVELPQPPPEYGSDQFTSPGVDGEALALAIAAAEAAEGEEDD